MDYLEERLQLAIDTAKKAGEYALRERQTGNFTVYNKKENDFVTDVDKNTEKFIYSCIKEAFPDDGFFGEESGNNKGIGRWVVDPIDGTTNFFRGLPNWAVSIAYEKEKFKPILGVIYLPCLNELFFAVKGKGAFLNGTPIHCSKNSKMIDSLMVCVLPHRHKEEYENYNLVMKEIGKNCSDIRSFGTCAQELAYIAAGYLDGYYELFLGYYDFAAGQVIVEEAGGKLTKATLDKDFSDFDCDIVVSNSYLHSQLENLING